MTFFITRNSVADDRGIILNVDENAQKHMQQYHALLRHHNFVTAEDTLGSSLYVMLDKADLMKAFNEHNSSANLNDSIVGFLVHFGFYGDTLQPSKGALIPYIRPLILDEEGNRTFYNEDVYEYLPNGCPNRCDVDLPRSLFGIWDDAPSGK